MKFQLFLTLFIGLSLSAADELSKSLCEVKVECLKGGDSKKGAQIVKILYDGQQLEAFDIGLLEESETLKNMLEDCPSREHIAPVVEKLLGQFDEHQLKLFIGALKNNACNAREYVDSHEAQDVHVLMHQANFYAINPIFDACIDHFAERVAELDIAQFDDAYLYHAVNKKVDMKEVQQAIMARLPVAVFATQLYKRRDIRSGIESAALNQDGTQLITEAGADIFVTDISSRKIRKHVFASNDYDPDNDSFERLIHNPNRSNFLFKTSYGVLYVDLARNIQKKIFSFGSDEPRDIVYAPNGKRFVIQTQQEVLIFDAQTGELIETVTLEQEEKIMSVEFARDRLGLSIKDNNDKDYCILLDINNPMQRQEFRLKSDEERRTHLIACGSKDLIGTSKRISMLDIPGDSSKEISFASNLRFLSLHPDEERLLITLPNRLIIMNLDDHSFEEVALSLHGDEMFRSAEYMQNGNRLHVIIEAGWKVRSMLIEFENYREFNVIDAWPWNDWEPGLHCNDLLVMSSGNNAVTINHATGVCHRLEMKKSERIRHIYCAGKEYVLCTNMRAFVHEEDGSYTPLWQSGNLLEFGRSCDLHKSSCVVASGECIRIKEICTQKQLNRLELHKKQLLHKALSSWQQNRPHAIAIRDVLSLPQNLQKKELFVGQVLERDATRVAYKNIMQKMLGEMQACC